ncbi:hypothetical protein [Caulobacter sp. 602-2]|uniref:hypothetical protein n=1 Tax=Caulobacter sp. 602-2 TaxID=2710887 RepID=UPI0013EA1C70|nr:hypothetical protein [Caulobacter sp. 602-2]
MLRKLSAAVAATALLSTPALAQDVVSPTKDAIMASFDIVRTEVKSVGPDVVFRVQVRGKAGEMKPKAVGQFAGSAVWSYVWPTSLNSSSVGFEGDQGILALAVTFHPDFDDAAYGGVNRHVWHPHWVVLVPDDACGKGALKVRDIPEGTKPKVPATWPGVPLLIDSPTYPTTLATDTVEVSVPASVIGAVEGVKFDGVTSALKVNANLHAPLLCISDIFDVASGDLSLPGKITR